MCVGVRVCVCACVWGGASLIAQLVKNPPAGNPGSVPGSGRSAGEGIGYPLQYTWASLGKESTCIASRPFG